MDRKVFIQALLWGLVALLLWNVISTRFWPPQKPGQATTQPVATTGPASTGDTAAASPPTATSSGKLRAVGADSEEAVTLGNHNEAAGSPFRVGLELSNRGAAIRFADLSDFAAEVDSPERYRLLRAVQVSENHELLSLAVEKVSVDGHDVPLSDVLWRSVPAPAGGEGETAAFEVDVVDVETDAPIIRLTRVYRLPRQAANEGRSDLFVDLAVENLTDRLMKVGLTERGPLGVEQAYSRTEDRYVYAALVSPDEPGVVSLEGKAFGKLKEDAVTLDSPEAPERILWTGVGNKYFTCVVVPLTAEGEEVPPCVQGGEALKLAGGPESTEAITARWDSSFALAGQSQWSQTLACYVGPNDKGAFTSEKNDDYVRRGFQQIVSVQYGSCAFGWLTDLMVLFLDGLHSVVRNYGVAIIILVLIVRACLHPVTKKGQVSMVRMQERMGKLQPKTELLKEKYANDKARLQQETMKIYQEEGVNPATSMLSSCLPMGLQMPIWIALYTSLANNVHMRHQPFVLWIRDLTAPDALVEFAQAYHVPIFGWEVTAFNLLPILLAISMIVQQKLMPKPQHQKSPGKAKASPQMDQAAQMQKMMPIMSVFFGIILYNMPSGLNLYIMASNIFGTLEQWRIRKHIKEAKEKGEDPAAPKKKDSDKPKKPSWFAKKLHELQKRAEDAQRVQGRRKT